MSRADRHGTGKSAPLDVRRIAAAVLPLQTEQLRITDLDIGTRRPLGAREIAEAAR